MRMLFVIVLGCSFLIAAHPSLAQLGPRTQQPAGALSRVTPEQVASAMTQAGFSSRVQTSKNEKYITTTMSGFNVRVFFFDCNNQGCGNFQDWSGFTKQESFTLEYVNAWNNQWRFAKANLDSDGNLIFSADVVVGGGVTLDNIKATAQLFDGLMSELAKFNP